MFKRDTIRKEQRAEFVCVHSTHLFPEAVLLVVHVKSPVIREEEKILGCLVKVGLMWLWQRNVNL